VQAAQQASAILKSCRAAPLDAGFANPNVCDSIPNGDYPATTRSKRPRRHLGLSKNRNLVRFSVGPMPIWEMSDQARPSRYLEAVLIGKRVGIASIRNRINLNRRNFHA
jgi:hypothetical protein